MHDPLVVAFEVRRPWPKRYRSEDGMAGRRPYFPALITVWHREPGGHDAGEVCRHYTRVQGADGKWHTTLRHGWKCHVHHWRVQVPALRELRRLLLTRCAWCGGHHRHRSGDAVNHGLSWDGPRGHWWQGEPGLYHANCASAKLARGWCVCDEPILEYDTWGHCLRCDNFRSQGLTRDALKRQRTLAQVPAGVRP